MSTKNKQSFQVWLLVSVFIVATSLFQQRWKKDGIHAPISFDISGYYMYLPSIFIYQDIKQQAFLPGIIEKYQPSTARNQSYLHSSGNYVMKYSAGMAVLMSPAFFVAHGIALISEYPADGFSRPYQVCLYFYSILIALIGLFLFRRLMLRHFTDSISSIIIFGIGLGTNLFLYSTVEALYSHNFLFCLGVLLILHTENWYQSKNLKDILVVAITGALMALSRPTEVIWLLVPCLWGILTIQDFKNRMTLWLQSWKSILLAAILYGCIGMIQLIYYKHVTGEWLVYSYKEQGFDWGSPHVWHVLVSYKKGWLVYTPMMILSLVGMIFMWLKQEKWAWAVSLFFIFNFYIVSSWSEWWYGGGFGQRALIQSYSLMAFPMGSLLVVAYRQKISKIIVWLFIGFFVLLNLFQSYQSQYGPFDTIYMTKSYFWRIFGQVKNEPFDTFLMDMPEDFRGERKETYVLFEDDFESPSYDTTAIHYSGQKAIYTDKEKAYSEHIIVPVPDISETDQWIRVSGQFYCTIKEWDTWRIPQFTVLLKSEDQTIKPQMIRVHRVLWYQEWKEAWMDFRIPPGKNYSLDIYLWNADGINNLYLDDLKVELYRG